MVICNECGCEVVDEAKFCKNCGAKIEIEKTENVNQTKFCANCGFEMDKNIKFCPECGNPTDNVSQTVKTEVVYNNEKNVALAAILSFLIIGLGQIYLGLTKKGIILLVLAFISGILTIIVIGWILWFIIWIYAIYDGYNSANKINSGINVEDTLDFNNLF